jgi:hypothetical protein
MEIKRAVIRDEFDFEMTQIQALLNRYGLDAHFPATNKHFYLGYIWRSFSSCY